MMKRAMTLLVGLTLAGCATPKLPKVDFLKLPEFREDFENIKDYPKVTEAPTVPTDTRSDKAWDDAARDIMKQRDSFSVPADIEAAETDVEIESRIDQLIEQAEAYKLDDPK